MHTPSFQRIVKILQMFGESRTQLAQKLGIPQNTFNRYFCEEHEEKLAQYLWEISELYPQVCREWLFFGEGEMLKDRSGNPDAAPAADARMALLQQRLEDMERKLGVLCAAEAARPVIPLVGFAQCGVVGWNGTMSLPIAADLPVLTPEMLAVVASGDSMVPAGISNGHVCYCDPSKPPLPGEAVYVERSDGLTALKIFIGKSRVGESEAGTDQTVFQGWLPTSSEGVQKPFTLVVEDALIKKIAPVILVRRRL